MSRIIQKKIVYIFACMVLCTASCRGADLPDQVKLDVLADQSKETCRNFLSETLYQRLSLKYNDGYLSDEHKKTLAQATKKYTEKIEQILNKQLEYKKQLEDYTADDWEEKFGSTGLWNKLKADIVSSQKRLLQIENSGNLQNPPPRDNCIDDFETNAAIAFVQLKAGSDEHLKKVIEKWPQSRELFGKLTLEKLDILHDYSTITSTQALLAAETAISNNPENHADILVKLTGITQLPVVFYAAGLATKKNKPQQAMEFFRQAGKDKNTAFADYAAGEAADLAYSLYCQKEIDCENTITAMETYVSRTTEDYNALYCYAFVLKDCQRKDDSLKVLGQIEKSKSRLALTAEYESILLTVEIEQNYLQAAEKLDNLMQKIHASKEHKELYNRLLETYCRVLLRLGGTENAQKVIKLSSGANLSTLTAKACWLLDKRAETIDQMLKIKTLTAEDVNFCTIILSQISANIDEFAQTEDKNFIGNCINIGEKMKQQRENPDTEFLILEFRTFQADSHCPETLKAQIEKMERQCDPNNSRFLRIYARFHTKTGDFQKAYSLWSELARVTEEKSADFWPAKYYQLLCLSKISEKDRQKAFHAAEVLLSSRKNMPEFWRQKLLNLDNTETLRLERN